MSARQLVPKMARNLNLALSSTRYFLGISFFRSERVTAGIANPNFLNAGSGGAWPESTAKVIFSGRLKLVFLGRCFFEWSEISAQFLCWLRIYSAIAPRKAR